MGTSVAMIDRTYGHLARDSEDGPASGRGVTVLASFIALPAARLHR
jgi:hypothetical protein